MNDFMVSLIRTYVPVIVSSVGAFFASRNVTIEETTLAGLTASLTIFFTMLYYGLVRLAERYLSPKFGWFLGYAKAPMYVVRPTLPPIEDAEPIDDNKTLPADDSQTLQPQQ